jgi:hypothetical protein
MEAEMRIGGAFVAIAMIWLLIGGAAAWQRHYFEIDEITCTKSADIALTVLAGPLNYTAVNPSVSCTLPQPST